MWIDFVILGLSIFLIFVVFYLSIFVHAVVLLVNYRMQDAPSYPGTGKRVLVIGDSTAVGCGATHSVPYWLNHLTGWDITVVARSGATVMYVDKHWPQKKFDHYVVMVGGNDLWKMVPLQYVHKCFNKFHRRRSVSHILVYDVRKSSSLPWFMKWYMHARQLKLRSMLNLDSKMYIDLYNDEEYNRELDNHHFLAMDGVHPSSTANRYIAQQLVQRIDNQ